MKRADQLPVEIHFVSLPSKELEERQERLRALLLRGALRWVRRQVCNPDETREVATVLIGGSLP